MKRCPQCNRVESDDTLAFCRVDGAALVSDSSSPDIRTATAASVPIPSEIETSLLPHSTGAGSSHRSTASATNVFDAQDTLARTRNLTTVKGRKIVAIILAGLVVIGLVLLAYFYLRRRNDRAIESTAVLPFVNPNNDPSTEYLADGIPENIINTLSQLPSLKVMSRNSVFHYKGKETDAQAVTKELNVQLVLTGCQNLRNTQRQGCNIGLAGTRLSNGA